MKALRTSSFSSLLVVAVMLFSWLVVTNHCALGLLTGAGATHAHCHAAKNDGSKNAPGDGLRECCRAIKASLADKADFKSAVAQVELQAYATLQLIPPPVVEPAPAIFLDHGPPRAASFAEIVLQRSLLSHAPPFTV